LVVTVDGRVVRVALGALLAFEAFLIEEIFRLEVIENLLMGLVVEARW
jgi:hypothetical protein